MNIILRGAKPPKYSWIGKWQITDCHTVVELTEDDVDAVKEIDGGYNQRPDMKIMCPVCEEWQYAKRYYPPEYEDQYGR
jgi:hypothetical protein